MTSPFYNMDSDYPHGRLFWWFVGAAIFGIAIGVIVGLVWSLVL